MSDACSEPKIITLPISFAFFTYAYIDPGCFVEIY